MKYLSQYTEQAISEALESNGAFYAFGTDQFNEAKKEGVEYVSLGAGLICPKTNFEQLFDQMNDALEKGIAQDLQENGKGGVILRELENHECYYTGDWEDCYEAVKCYGITRAEVNLVYIQKRSEQNN